jgi:pantothenate kinase type III
VLGGIKECSCVYKSKRVFLTGGQAAVLAPELPGAEWWPTMTLAGVARVAEGRR